MSDKNNQQQDKKKQKRDNNQSNKSNKIEVKAIKQKYHKALVRKIPLFLSEQ